MVKSRHWWVQNVQILDHQSSIEKNGAKKVGRAENGRWDVDWRGGPPRTHTARLMKGLNK